MNTVLLLSVWAATLSAILAYLITPWVITIATKLNLVDDPKTHKHPKVIHTYPVPRGGGLAIFFSIVVSALIFIPPDKHLVGILLGATMVVLLGLFDDKYDLNPALRLVIQFIAAGIPIAAGVGIAFINNPLGGLIDLSHPQISFAILGNTHSIWVLSDIFAVVWIVFMMNMLNMGAKGIDGQLPGVVTIASITIAILSLKYSADITQWPIILLAAITAGAYFGFLPWNFYPQKIMPSYSGSTLAGYLLAVLSILSTTKVGALLVVLGVPLIDTGYTIIRRIASGKSPLWGDRGHLHHRLLDYGLSKRQVVYFYWITTAVLGFLAVNLNSSLKLYTIVGVGVFVGGLILWLTHKNQKKIKG